MVVDSCNILPSFVDVLSEKCLVLVLQILFQVISMHLKVHFYWQIFRWKTLAVSFHATYFSTPVKKTSRPHWLSSVVGTNEKRNMFTYMWWGQIPPSGVSRMWFCLAMKTHVREISEHCLFQLLWIIPYLKLSGDEKWFLSRLRQPSVNCTD